MKKNPRLRRKTLRFFFDERKENEVTALYMQILRDSISALGYPTTDAKSSKRRRSDVLVENEMLRAFFRICQGFSDFIIWMQGIVPEESYLRHSSGLRQAVLSRMERFVLRRAKFVFFVSPAMRRHYEEKYSLSFEGRCFVMPCFSETDVREQAFSEEKYAGHTFVYVGSLAAWQCFDETLRLYGEIEKKCGGDSKLFVFTSETEQASRMLAAAGILRYEVSYRSGEALSQELAKIRYGFALRRKDPVNAVATPVKLSTYAANGLIPIYSPVLEDFSKRVREMNYGIPIDADVPSPEPILADMSCTPAPETIQKICRTIFRDYYNKDVYMAGITVALENVFGKNPEKKRLLFVINRMETGGIPRALCALLRELCPRYHVSLLAVSGGELMAELPAQVELVSAGELVRSTEIPLSELSRLSVGARIFRLFSAVFTKLVGKAFPFFLASRSARCRIRHYDAAISFCQPLSDRNFGNICNELVQNACDADRKLTFLHGDFPMYGGNTRYSRRLYRRFDGICAVSEGTAARFLTVMPELTKKVSVVENIIDVQQVRALARESAIVFDKGPVMISVSRLAPEKGLERMMPLVARLRKTGVHFSWHIIGDGPRRTALSLLIREFGLCDCVFLHGALQNPFPYMAAADFLLLPSFHEAAPLVIGEAEALGLPVLTTDTCSARELVGSCGFVCEGDDESLYAALRWFLGEKAYERFQISKDEISAGMERRRAASIAAFERALDFR